MSEIIAPIPQRHLLQTHESHHWLRYSSRSPGPSRTVSPVAQTLSNATNHHSRRHLSFGTLTDQDKTSRSHLSHILSRDEAGIASRGKLKYEHGMGRRWIWWAHKNGMKQWVVPGIILASIWVRWGVGLGSYSGQFTHDYCPHSFLYYQLLREEYSAHVWRLRSAEALDGIDYSPSCAGVVYVWFTILGTWLSTVDCVCFMVLWHDVSFIVFMLGWLWHDHCA